MFFSDGFCVRGTDFDKFVEACDSVDNATKYVDFRADNLLLLPIIEKTDDKIVCLTVQTDGLTDAGKLVLERGPEFSDEEWNQIDKALPAASVNGQIYFLRDIAYKELWRHIGKVSGSGLNVPSVFRELHLTDLAQKSNAKLKACVRWDDDNRQKMLSVRTDRYNVMAQSTVPAIISLVETTIGESFKILRWEVNHDYTTIEIFFPDIGKRFQEKYGIADLEPGMRIRNSGTGYSTLRAEEVWKIRDNTFDMNLVSEKHIGSWSSDKFLSDANDMIVKKFSRVPEAMAKLVDETVDEGNACTEIIKLIEKSGLPKVVKAADHRAWDHVERHTAGVRLIDSFAAWLYSYCHSEFFELGLPCTKYDLVCKALTVGSFKALPETYRKQMQHQIGAILDV